MKHFVSPSFQFGVTNGSQVSAWQLARSSSSVARYGRAPGKRPQQINLSQYCWAQHVACVWPPSATCCDMLNDVGFCWLKFENGQIYHATFVDVACCCSRLSRSVQQSCAQACALVRFQYPMCHNASQQGGQTYSTCNNIMLGYVAELKSCAILNKNKHTVFRQFKPGIIKLII